MRLKNWPETVPAQSGWQQRCTGFDSSSELHMLRLEAGRDCMRYTCLELKLPPFRVWRRHRVVHRWGI